MLTRTTQDLQAYLSAHSIPAEIIHLDAETPTVTAAAEALGIPVNQVVKTVIFMIDGRPYAVLANGVRRVDPRKLAARFGVSRKKVRLADASMVISLTGYAPGTVPPFDHREPVNLLMETAVTEQDIVYAGGGGIAAMLRIHSADLQRLTHADVFDVLEESTTDANTDPD